MCLEDLLYLYETHWWYMCLSFDHLSIQAPHPLDLYHFWHHQMFVTLDLAKGGSCQKLLISACNLSVHTAWPASPSSLSILIFCESEVSRSNPFVGGELPSIWGAPLSCTGPTAPWLTGCCSFVSMAPSSLYWVGGVFSKLFSIVGGAQSSPPPA